MQSLLSIQIIVQARMGSRRLPGKSLRLIRGKPMLAHVLDAVAQCGGSAGVCVATSTGTEDDAIARFCSDYGVSVHRGDPENVASRFRDILSAGGHNSFIRVNGDSPLWDYRVVDRIFQCLADPKVDIATTVADPPFPSGMNAEGLRSSVFLNAYPLFQKPGHFEHVTPYFYENHGHYEIVSLPPPVERPRDYKFTVDTEDDFHRMESLMESFQKPHFAYTLDEKCAIYDSLFRDTAC